MTKKRLLVAFGLVAFIGIILGVLAMLPPHTGVTKANFDRVELGMGRAEVEAIFGGPSVRKFQYRVDREVYVRRIWLQSNGNDGAWIEFADDHVCDSGWGGIDETILDKIRRWLHLR